MGIPKIRHDVAQGALRRLLDPKTCPLADLVDMLNQENPEYLRSVGLLAGRSDVEMADALFIACVCYHLLLAQEETDQLEAMVGGERAPACLR
jgi:hypothetical protein